MASKMSETDELCNRPGQTRQLINGELDSLISEGIRGLTSNPTIFQKDDLFTSH